MMEKEGRRSWFSSRGGGGGMARGRKRGGRGGESAAFENGRRGAARLTDGKQTLKRGGGEGGGPDEGVRTTYGGEGKGVFSTSHFLAACLIFFFPLKKN